MLEFSRQQEHESRHLIVVHAVLGIGMPGPRCYISNERDQKIFAFVLNGVKCCGSE